MLTGFVDSWHDNYYTISSPTSISMEAPLHHLILPSSSGSFCGGVRTSINGLWRCCFSVIPSWPSRWTPCAWFLPPPPGRLKPDGDASQSHVLSGCSGVIRDMHFALVLVTQAPLWIHFSPPFAEEILSWIPRQIGKATKIKLLLEILLWILQIGRATKIMSVSQEYHYLSDWSNYEYQSIAGDTDHWYGDEDRSIVEDIVMDSEDGGAMNTMRVLEKMI
ncbi:hypothetical protein L484_023482 [Morus notabilis]|uniref:Uncharacterized protein n=1 Tax=Morus notabilis TaxID=981085 RepID=W9RDN8_9ROSA|nr:hypothetical protein L484_023482 [Morus notabilis]